MSKLPWDMNRALEVFRKVFPERTVCADDVAQRVGDMNAIRMAQTLAEATRHVTWGYWYGSQTARRLASRIRRFK